MKTLSFGKFHEPEDTKIPQSIKAHLKQQWLRDAAEP